MLKKQFKFCVEEPANACSKENRSIWLVLPELVLFGPIQLEALLEIPVQPLAAPVLLNYFSAALGEQDICRNASTIGKPQGVNAELHQEAWHWGPPFCDRAFLLAPSYGIQGLHHFIWFILLGVKRFCPCMNGHSRGKNPSMALSAAPPPPPPAAPNNLPFSFPVDEEVCRCDYPKRGGQSWWVEGNGVGSPIPAFGGFDGLLQWSGWAA